MVQLHKNCHKIQNKNHKWKILWPLKFHDVHQLSTKYCIIPNNFNKCFFYMYFDYHSWLASIGIQIEILCSVWICTKLRSATQEK
jgi:hypothetical protein